ncbi:MAG: hypothetical protein HY660_18515 [Armatimonadetes bacterium]|nr:hypothetical protein [Armatimonadota bacterium]
MPEGQPQAEERPTAAFVLSLLGGLWMLSRGTMMSGGSGWMWGPGMMRGWGPGVGWPWLGVIAGLVVLAGAVLLHIRPAESRTWGLVILIASALYVVLGVGGFLAGALGVIGGALALSWRPRA